MIEIFKRNSDGNFDEKQCCHCWEYKCDCDKLPNRKCKYCGRIFKGKHYFSWAFHEAACQIKDK